MTEIYKNGSLRSLLFSENKLKESMIPSLVLQLAEVLKFYEENNYVNGNLSLSTIMLTDDLQEIRIID